MYIGVIRLDRLGDTVLTLPAIKVLKEFYKEHKIVGIFNNYNYQLFVYRDKIIHPYFDFIEIVPIKLYYKKFGGNIFIDLFNYMKVFFTKMNYRFDKLFVFSPTTVSYLLGSVIDCKSRYTYFYESRFNRNFFSKKYTYFLDSIDKSMLSEDSYDSVRHEVYQNLEVVKLDLKEVGMDTKIELFLPSGMNFEVYDVLFFDKELFFDSQDGIKWITNFVNSSFEKLNSLSKKSGLNLKYGFVSNRKHLIKYLSGSIISPSIVELMGLISNSRCIVCFDSGIVHLASAFGVNLVSIFTNRFFEFDVRRWGPLNSNSVVLKLDLFNEGFIDFTLTDPIDFSEQVLYYVQKFL